MAIHNLMTGSGFLGGAYSSQWISAWIAVAILALVIFIIFLLQKNDLMPIDFSIPASSIGIFIAILLITLFGWTKIAFALGFIGIIGGGAVLGRFLE